MFASRSPCRVQTRLKSMGSQERKNIGYKSSEMNLSSNQLSENRLYSLNSTYNFCALKNLQFIFQEKKFEPEPGFEERSEVRISVQVQIFLLKSKLNLSCGYKHSISYVPGLYNYVIRLGLVLTNIPRKIRVKLLKFFKITLQIFFLSNWYCTLIHYCSISCINYVVLLYPDICL